MVSSTIAQLQQAASAVNGRHSVTDRKLVDAHATTRRGLLSLGIFALPLLGVPLTVDARPSNASSPTARGPPEPPAPVVGSCVECIGEVNGGLNACTLSSPSCVSTQNDDENHFVPPWQYTGSMEGAITDLISTIEGGQSVGSDLGYQDTDLQDSKLKRGKGKPPSFSGAAESASNPGKACFNGRLESRHRINDGSEYLHFVFGGQSGAQSKPACRNIGVIDAEFVFLAGDKIVDIRTASRENPGVKGGSLSLSMSYGVQYDTNVAKREMEEMRKALRWEQVPVVTDFDPRFNQRRPLFFERLYQPFLPSQNKQDFEDVVDK